MFDKYIFFKIETNKVKKITLFNETRKYNIQIFDKNIFFKIETNKVKKNNAMIQDITIHKFSIHISFACILQYLRKMYLSKISVLYCLVSLNSVLL